MLPRIPVLVIALVVIGGCSKGSDFYTVTGSVTYQGKPVPTGEIQFMPDSTKGNRGPSVMATIRSGEYATPKSRGIVGGPYVLFITGYKAAAASADPTAPDYGTQLFERTEQQFDFPKEDCRHDIAVDSLDAESRP